MARTVGGWDSETENAKVRSGKVSRRATRCKEFDWTPGPRTVGQRIKRALID